MSAQLQIPLETGNADFEFDVDLDGSTYKLRLWWCGTLNLAPIADGASTGFWMLFLMTPGGTPIAQARAVVGWPMFWRVRGTHGLPPGTLTFVDTTGQGLSPGVGDLGQRVQLIYAPAT